MKKTTGLLLLGWLAAGAAMAQQQTGTGQSIYMCVDAKGRKLTSDRPILDCIDREQSIMGSNGIIRNKLGPSLTARERAEVEAKEKAANEERDRIAAERQRNRALITRYPNRAAHDAARKEALAPLQLNIQAIQHRVDELEKTREGLLAEMEFYKKDPTKAPAKIRNQMDENTQAIATQRQAITAQEKEISRVNAMFDEELHRLTQFWNASNPAAAASR